MYLVTKRVTAGVLEGLIITEETPVKFTAGETIKAACSSTVYVVDKVEEV